MDKEYESVQSWRLLRNLDFRERLENAILLYVLGVERRDRFFERANDRLKRLQACIRRSEVAQAADACSAACLRRIRLGDALAVHHWTIGAVDVRDVGHQPIL
jgi:hypothetical protein